MAQFASEIYASTEEPARPVDVQEKPAPRKRGRDEKPFMSVVPEREPVAAQPVPPPPPPAPAPVARVEEPLRVTPPAEPLRITPPAEPLRITPTESSRATASEHLRVTPSEPVRVTNEPLRITPLREPEPERIHGAYVPAASAEPKPELVPVPASVFDDDFFRKSNDELRPGPEPRSWETGRDTKESRAAESSQDLETGALPERTKWPEAKVPSFAGYAGGGSSSSEEDELDIPAFLRRSR
jgi:cell division protein FtsZ